MGSDAYQYCPKRLRQRELAFDIIGKYCRGCWVDDIAELQLDHIYNDAPWHREEPGGPGRGDLTIWVIANPDEARLRIQTLRADCNMRKPRRRGILRYDNPLEVESKRRYLLKMLDDAKIAAGVSIYIHAEPPTPRELVKIRAAMRMVVFDDACERAAEVAGIDPDGGLAQGNLVKEMLPTYTWGEVFDRQDDQHPTIGVRIQEARLGEA